mgnify:CR=1 FL=1
MKKSIIVLVSSFSFFVNADHDSKWPSGSAKYAIEHSVENTKKYKIKANKLMEEIFTKLDSKYHATAIKEQISAWDEFIDKTCNIVGISSGGGGSWSSTYHARCEEGLSYDRYFATKNALKCIERVEKQTYISRGEKLHCVVQTLNVKVF